MADDLERLAERVQALDAPRMGKGYRRGYADAADRSITAEQHLQMRIRELEQKLAGAEAYANSLRPVDAEMLRLASLGRQVEAMRRDSLERTDHHGWRANNKFGFNTPASALTATGIHDPQASPQYTCDEKPCCGLGCPCDPEVKP